MTTLIAAAKIPDSADRANLAVDLTSQGIRDYTSQQQHKQQANDQLERLTRRIAYLERKHARLPISNGKTKTAKQIDEAKALRQQLAKELPIG